MKHVLSERIYINCDESPNISFGSNTPSPSKKNLYLIDQAGNVITGEEPETVIEAANQCNRRALSSPDEAAKTGIGKIEVKCQAFTRNTAGNAFRLALKRP